MKSLHIESENEAMEFNVHEHTDNCSPAQSMFDIALLSIIADKVTSNGAEISFYSQMTPEKHQKATEFTDYYSGFDPQVDIRTQ